MLRARTLTPEPCAPFKPGLCVPSRGSIKPNSYQSPVLFSPNTVLLEGYVWRRLVEAEESSFKTPGKEIAMGLNTKCPIHHNLHPDYLCPDKNAYDGIKEKARLALAVPKLVEIVKEAPINESGSNKGKINLNWCERQALQYVLEDGASPKIAEQLAKSAYYLAMMRRDYEEKLNMLLSSMRLVPEDESVGVYIYAATPEIEFLEPRHLKLRFPDRWRFLYFCIQLINHELSEVLKYNNKTGGALTTRNAVIRLLEERFGLKVRVCGNCKYRVKTDEAVYGYIGSSQLRRPSFTCAKYQGEDPNAFFGEATTCTGKEINGVLNAWESKEVSE